MGREGETYDCMFLQYNLTGPVPTENTVIMHVSRETVEGLSGKIRECDIIFCDLSVPDPSNNKRLLRNRGIYQIMARAKHRENPSVLKFRSRDYPEDDNPDEMDESLD